MTYRNAFLLDYCFPWQLLDSDLTVFSPGIRISDPACVRVLSLSLGQAAVGGTLSHILHTIHPHPCCPEGMASVGCCGMGGSDRPTHCS